MALRAAIGAIEAVQPAPRRRERRSQTTGRRMRQDRPPGGGGPSRKTVPGRPGATKGARAVRGPRPDPSCITEGNATTGARRAWPPGGRGSQLGLARRPEAPCVT